MSSDSVLAVDIGGANLKFASRERCWSEPLELWHQREQLRARLAANFRGYQQILVTMTGELADCFQTRRLGVIEIARDVVAAAEQVDASERFYRLDGQFCRLADVLEDPILFAATNWHATASVWSRIVTQPSLMVDIGSTTTDLIPIDRGRIETDADDDFTRLCEGTLLYIGDRRTPVCGIVDDLDLRGRRSTVMNEVFATMADVRCLLGFGSGQTRDAATRMLRMVGSDLDDHTLDDAVQMAQQVHRTSVETIRLAMDRWGERDLIFIGHAADLIAASASVSVAPLQTTGGSADESSPTALPVGDPAAALLQLWRNQQCRTIGP